MKKRLKNSFRLSMVLVGIGSAVMAQAQTFTTLHSFTGVEGAFSIDGAFPIGGLLLARGWIYGTTASGGNVTNGTVFKMKLDGTGFTNLYRFTTGGTDGAGPNGSLVLSGNTLYGTCAAGGSGGNGLVFALNTDGTGFGVLHSFTNIDGANPQAGLILVGNALYGTTIVGGAGGSGTVFCLNTNGSGYTNLHSFTSEGPYPIGALLSLSDTLYGTTEGVFSGGNPITDRPGTIFSLNADGSAFTTLHTNGHPKAELILFGNTLYGTTAESFYTGEFGSVFKINTDGTGFSVLHAFTPTASSPQVNSDGADPEAGLILSGNTLYGTCVNGGSSGKGTIFAINTDGSGFTNLYSFTGGSDGAYPFGSLIFSGHTLYGTASKGGSAGYGTVFSLTLPQPQLRITPMGEYMVLTWPTNYAGVDYSGFTLQSKTNLAFSAWTTASPAPVVVNGQYTVTNPITGTQQFCRLSQ